MANTSADSWPTVISHSADCCLTVSQLSADMLVGSDSLPLLKIVVNDDLNQHSKLMQIYDSVYILAFWLPSDLAGVLGIRSRDLNASCPDIENKSRVISYFLP